MSFDQKRCLGYHCPDSHRNNCVWHMRAYQAGELCFQSQRVGEECDNFKPFRKTEAWGVGPEAEAND
jgi:hypothetical protein